MEGNVLGWGAIFGQILIQFMPVWIGMAVIFAVSIYYRANLGLYGKLFSSTVGMIGFSIVLFWVLTAFFAPLIVTHDPLAQPRGLRHVLPGAPVPEGTEGFSHYLLGGDNLARDVFSRMVAGSGRVIAIAPLATLVAFMVGCTLGLPAGYRGGRLDTLLSFLANLILAFPVILLFYLLVTPEIRMAGIPSFLAMVLFIIPVAFMILLLQSRFSSQPQKAMLYTGSVAIVGFAAYLMAISQPGTPINFLPKSIDLIDPDPGLLVVFVSVVFVNAPTVFRIVRGLALDIKTRDYVSAAQTRGEGHWYIMLWEILPNARGPLIVDFCLRIGYTTILLGTLGFFGLGLEPSSPDWGNTIKDGAQRLRAVVHTAVVPALALMSLVLGLNLLADGLREESLKD